MAEHDTSRTSTGRSAGTHAQADPDSHLSSRRPAQPNQPGDHAIGHGNSLAAWVAVSIVLAGSLVGCFAVVFAQVWLFWVGVGLIVLGLVVGKILSMMGFGQKTEPTSGAASGGRHA